MKTWRFCPVWETGKHADVPVSPKHRVSLFVDSPKLRIAQVRLSLSSSEEWLDSLPADALVGIDDGGLTLQHIGAEAYLEIGGIPEYGNIGRGGAR